MTQQHSTAQHSSTMIRCNRTTHHDQLLGSTVLALALTVICLAISSWNAVAAFTTTSTYHYHYHFTGRRCSTRCWAFEQNDSDRDNDRDSNNSNSNSNSAKQNSGGFFDRVKNSLNFFEDRQVDFVKLDDMQDVYGPGPCVVLYNVPSGVTTEEVMDMIQDGAPVAFEKDAVLYRTTSLDQDAATSSSSSNQVQVLDLSLQQALEGIVTGTYKDNYQEPSSSRQLETLASLPSCVILFSGFSNSEMLDTYKILANEIYEESQGALDAACAKAVPNAMAKPLRQVLEEIGGDHKDAIEQQQLQQ